MNNKNANYGAVRQIPVRIKKQIDELKMRLEEAEQTIEAIREGHVDALIDHSGKMVKIYTVKGAETAYRIMVDNMNEGAMTLDDEGIVLYANERIGEMFGVSPSLVTGKVIHNLVERRYHKLFNSLLKDASTGKRVHCDLYFLKKNSRFPAYVSFAPFGLDGKTNICMVITDLTERKVSEERLWKLNTERHLRTQLKEVLENIADAVIVYTPEGKLIEFNAAAAKLWGIDRVRKGIKYTEILKRFEVFDIEGNKIPIDKWPYSLSLKGKAFNNFQCRVFNVKNKKEFFLSFSSSPILEDRKISFIVLSVHDITNQKKYELAVEESKRVTEQRASELDALNKELESFSYSVAHDLRNPLKTISGFVEALTEDCSGMLNEECKDYLKRIKRGTERMNSIIEDILALARISRQEIEIVDLDMSIMARLSIDELNAADPDRKVEIEIQDGLNARADPRLMSVILGNLLSNAWKFTLKVQHAKIEFGAFEKMGQAVYFIKDNGAGFNKINASKLFTPFQRLHSEQDFPGMGVGLAIVERAINRLGGKIWAESELGRGAVFYFTIAGNC